MRQISRSETLDIRGIRYHIRHWGADSAPLVFFLHGWMDSSATFQFVVDALRQEWHIVAPDWRGYGASEWLGRPYWFPDYYGDLEKILDHYAPGTPVRVVGHSMGAHIAANYAGLRPARFAQLVMLDFLGLLSNKPEETPGRLCQWLDQLDGSPRMASYADHAAMAARFRQSNSRLTAERANFLAAHVTHALPDGRLQLACDPWHRVPSAYPYHAEDSLACWQKIAAPVLLLMADKGFVHDRFAEDPGEYERRLACFTDKRVETLPDAGHNVQHDQPEQVANALERFLSR